MLWVGVLGDGGSCFYSRVSTGPDAVSDASPDPGLSRPTSVCVHVDV